MLYPVAQSHGLDHLEGTLLALGRTHPAVQQGHLHVVQDIERGDQVEALEDKSELGVAEAGGLAGIETRDGLAVQLHGTGRGLVEQSGDVEQGGLAAAGGAHDTYKFSFAHFEVDVVESHGLDLGSSVDFGNFDKLDHNS